MKLINYKYVSAGMRHKMFAVIAMASVLLVASCKKVSHSSLFPGDSKPSQLVKAQVANLPGAANITYSLPGDNSILYVKASYEIRPGVIRESKASYYANSLVVDGFGDTLAHEVKLYVVNRSDIASDPTVVTVKPLTPPVITVYKSLKVTPDFGGVSVSFKNPSNADMVIVMMAADSVGKMAIADTKYTAADSAVYSIRGFDSTARRFGFYVKDVYGNYSDTTYATYKPLYEKFLDKSKFREVDLPTDVHDDWGLLMPNLWDGIIKGGLIGGFYHTQAKPFPMWFTFDLGVKVKLSRITLWPRQDPPEDWIYNQNNPKHFQVWGCSDAFPAADGGWSNWTLLVDHEVIKPSGLPLGSVTQADIDAAAKGEEMTVPLSMPAVRYIRVKVLETYTNAATNIAEMSFWGQP